MNGCHQCRDFGKDELHSDHWPTRKQTTTTTIPLPWSKPPLTGNRTRGNPYARAAEVKQAKEAARFAVFQAMIRGQVGPMVGANVTLHFQMPDRRRRDADGLAPTLKVCLDALVAEGVLPDDSWVHVPAATCRIHPPNGEPAAMWLELTDPDEETP
jgi:Holliday junction resolvase RusA-like endonuclease